MAQACANHGSPSFCSRLWVDGWTNGPGDPIVINSNVYTEEFREEEGSSCLDWGEDRVTARSLWKPFLPPLVGSLPTSPQRKAAP